MNLDLAFWGAGFVANIAVFVVLLWKRRARTFPIFTTWIGSMLLGSIILFCVRRWAGDQAYYNAYWSLSAPNYILQVGVLCEICQNVIHPYRRSFPKGAFYLLAILISLGSLISIAIASRASLSTLESSYGTLLRIDLGFALARCAVFAAITLFADALGLNWRHHVQRVATGLAIYSLADLVAASIRVFVQPGSASYYAVGYVDSMAYLLAVGVWAISFFQAEPVRGTLSPAAELFLGNLHRRFSLGRRNL